ncbi:MAG: HipA domain-containing protein [Chthoniobacterales bacterium]|nr:HipA domain-containing protein [Chthoniobacterales bacterium]
MSERVCKICLEPIEDAASDYHPSCSRKLFGSSHPPKLPYSGKDLDALAEQVVRQHIAVPGVQPKLSLHLERAGRSDSGCLTLVGLDGGYILKPAVERFPEMPELEHLTMQMAKGLGIETAACGIIDLEDGKKALIVLRMDRVKGEKLAMEDMCQLGDKLAEEKYRGSIESVGRIILKHCGNPGFDVLRFYEVMLFCFLTGNADMHFKNFSLIRSSEGEIRFSPSYDLLPTFLLLPSDTEESALTINGKKKRLELKNFRACGASLQLTERQMANSLRRIEKGLPGLLSVIERGLCSRETKDRYRNLVLDRWQRLVKNPEEAKA